VAQGFLPLSMHERWGVFFDELHASGNGATAKYLQKEYIHRTQVASLQKAFNLEVDDHGCRCLWFAPFWAGTLGTVPGSASGSQSIEAFHSCWQRELATSSRTSCLRILETMQGLF